MAGVRAFTEELRGIRARVAVFEPGVYSADECAALAEELMATEKACATAGARAAARAAECGAHRERGYADASDWVAAASGSTTGVARDALKAIAAVERCPDTKDALLVGSVSLAQAGEIARTAAEVPGSELELLELAKRAGLGAVRDRARKRRVESIPVDELHEKQLAARAFRHSMNDLGNVVIFGELTPEIGIPIVNRVDAETDRVRRDARAAGHDEPREAFAADAFARIFREGGTVRSKAADIVITIDWQSFRRGSLVPRGQSKIVGGGPIPPALVREMANDAFLKAVLHDGVDVQRVLHLRRSIPAEIATALRIGEPPEFDGAVCSEPACDRRYHLEIDHVDPLANGGVTNAGNLRLLCSPHHAEKTGRDRDAGLLGTNRRRSGRAPP